MGIKDKFFGVTIPESEINNTFIKLLPFVNRLHSRVHKLMSYWRRMMAFSTSKAMMKLSDNDHKLICTDKQSL